MMTYKDIQGWFDYENLYDEQVSLLKDGDTIVEIGCWLGKSSCYLAQKIKESNKKIELFCIDLWDYTNDDTYYHLYKETHTDLLDTFINNAKLLGVSDIIKTMKGDSVYLADIFKENSVDFIFIDGNHYSPYIDNDIKAWYPKLKNGGYIAGHDYNDAEDVRLAVNNYFKGNFTTIGSCWKHLKN